MTVSEELARVLKNALRARLLFEYQGEPTSPSRVAARLNESLSLVSYHTDVLVRHRCLELVRMERRRGATEHFYRRVVGPIVEDHDWENLPVALRRALIQSTLGMATDEVRAAALDGGFDEARAHFSRMLLELDDAGLLAVSEVLRRALREVEEIHAACRARAVHRLEPYELLMFNFGRSSAPEPPVRP